MRNRKRNDIQREKSRDKYKASAQSEEYRKKKNDAHKRWRAKPLNKAKELVRDRGYKKKPEAKRNTRDNKPEAKAKQKTRRNKPGAKAKRKTRDNKPEAKAKQKTTSQG